MSYSDFSIAAVQQAFELTLQETQPLLVDLEPISPSASLTQTLTETLPLALAINTEKARSELLITPILLEVRRLLQFQIGYFSGVEFSVDPAQGLSGQCDFILSRSTEQLYVRAPVVMIMEAKNEDIKSGLGQCIAAMVAAKIFNERSGNSNLSIYGAVTIGTTWRFLKLTDRTVHIDVLEYYINQLDKILALLIYPLKSTSVGVV